MLSAAKHLCLTLLSNWASQRPFAPLRVTSHFSLFKKHSLRLVETTTLMTVPLLDQFPARDENNLAPHVHVNRALLLRCFEQ